MSESTARPGASGTAVARALERAGIPFVVTPGPGPEVDLGDHPAPVVIVIDGREEAAARLELGAVTVDLRTGTIVRDGEARSLRRREWALINALARRRGETVPTSVLLSRVWGRLDRRAALHTTLRRLRLRVEADPDRPRWLVTVRGVGVRLEGGGTRPPA